MTDKKKTTIFPKGLLLIFNLALCTNNNVLREQYDNILLNASHKYVTKWVKHLVRN